MTALELMVTYAGADLSRDIRRNYPSLGLRAGALPFRLGREAEMEFLLVRRRNHCFWSLPKGRLMPPMGLHEVASIEAYEEAGAVGEIRTVALGSYLHSKTPKIAGTRPEVVEVVVFPLEVDSLDANWPEMDNRERRWFPHHRAVEMVGPGQLRDLLTEFAEECVLEVG